MLRALILSAICLGTPLAAQDQPDRPYVFTYSHNNTTQQVLSGRSVQIQLPAGPATWVPQSPWQNAELTERAVFASPGRIPGTSVVETFDISISGTDDAVVLLARQGSSGTVLPDGLFSITLVSVTP